MMCVECGQRPVEFLQRLCRTCYLAAYPASGAAEAERKHLEIASQAPAEVASEGRIRLVWACDVTPERIEWLGQDRLPLADLVVIAGEPGLGKSTTTAAWGAEVTLGSLEGALRGQPRSVLIASAEDHFESVIWGRLKAAGADMQLVANVKVTNNDMLQIPGDVEAIAAKCREARDAGRPPALIVVDPISAFLAGIDSHKDAAVRSALAPLAALAQEQHVCVLVVGHLNKASAGKLLDRLNGSIAFGAAPRSVLAFARDPDDPEGEQGNRRVIVHAKSNHGRYAPTLAAHIEAVEIAEVGSTVSRLVIDGESDVSPEDLQPDASGGQSGARADAEDFIATYLGDGQPHDYSEVKAAAAANDISASALDRASRRLKILKRREGSGAAHRSLWSLPPSHSADGSDGSDGSPRPSLPTPVTPVTDITSLTQPGPDESYEAWEARLAARFGGAR